MGKRSRAQRAARQGKDERTVIAGHSASRQTPIRMTTPHKPVKPAPRKRSAASDALTGEPLTRGTFRLWMRDYDTARELYRGEPIPYSLHSRQMETGGGASGDYLGAHVLSRAALRYFAHAVVSAAQAIDGQYAWWLDGYVVGRLTARFGERVVLSAAAYERGQMDVREIARVYQVPVKRVIGWAHTVGRAARAYLRPPRTPARPVRAAPAPAAQVYREPTGGLMEYAESA